MTPTPEQYEAAALLERLAIGDDGERREVSRQIILDGGASARQVAHEARAVICGEVAKVERAIRTLGLER